MHGKGKVWGPSGVIDESKSGAGATLFTHIDYKNEGVLNMSELHARLSDAGQSEAEISYLMKLLIRDVPGGLCSKQQFSDAYNAMQYALVGRVSSELLALDNSIL